MHKILLRTLHDKTIKLQTLKGWGNDKIELAYPALILFPRLYSYNKV